MPQLDKQKHTGNRKTMLAKVHIAKKQIGMTDEQYRFFLDQEFGVESAGDLDDAGLNVLLRRFADLGFKASARGSRSTAPRGNYIRIDDADPDAKQKRYILALAAKVGWDLQGLNKRIRQQFGVEDIRWLKSQKDLQTLAKDLNNRCKRKGLDPEPRRGGRA